MSHGLEAQPTSTIIDALVRAGESTYADLSNGWIESLSPVARRDSNAYATLGLTLDAVERPDEFPDPVWKQPPLWSIAQRVMMLYATPRETTRWGVLIQSAPEHQKTRQVLEFVAWSIGQGRHNVQYVCPDDTLAKNGLQWVRLRLLEPWHRSIFPDQGIPSGETHGANRTEWSEKTLTFVGHTNPVMQRRSLGQRVIGVRAHLCVLEDCCTDKGAIHPVTRQREEESVRDGWLQRGALSGKFIWANNNRHPSDYFHTLVSTGDFCTIWVSIDSPDNASMTVLFDGFEPQDFDRIFGPDQERCQVTRLSATSARVQTSLLPRWSAQRYRGMARAIGSIQFSRLYGGHNPNPETSILGLRTSWGWVEPGEIEPLERIVGFHDPSTGRARDYSSTCLIGVEREGRRRKVVLAQRTRMIGYDAQARQVADMVDWARDRFPGIPIQIHVESNAQQRDAFEPRLEAVHDERRRNRSIAQWHLPIEYSWTREDKDASIHALDGPITSREMVFQTDDFGPNDEPALDTESIRQIEEYNAAAPDKDAPDSLAKAWRAAVGPPKTREVIRRTSIPVRDVTLEPYHVRMLAIDAPAGAREILTVEAARMHYDVVVMSHRRFESIDAALRAHKPDLYRYTILSTDDRVTRIAVGDAGHVLYIAKDAVDAVESMRQRVGDEALAVASGQPEMARALDTLDYNPERTEGRSAQLGHDVPTRLALLVAHICWAERSQEPTRKPKPKTEAEQAEAIQEAALRTGQPLNQPWLELGDDDDAYTD